MLVLDNVFKSTWEKFFHFYSSLSSEARFVFFAIVALLVILAVLVFILVDQIRHNKKVTEKANVPETIPTEVKEENNMYEENEKTKNLQEITQKIQAVIDSRNNDVNTYEKAQEENSIISYDELLKAAGKVKEEPIEEIKEEVKSEIINEVKEETNNIARQIQPDEVIEEIKPTVNEIREDRFKTSDFISPIFGVQNKSVNNNVDNIKMEEPINPAIEEKVIEEDDAEILTFSKEEEEFLLNLKNLRNNLN